MTADVEIQSIEELIGWTWAYRGLYQDRMWMRPDGNLTEKRYASMEDMLEWIKETYPGANLALTTTLEGTWSFIIEYADGRWKSSTGEHVTLVIENVIRQLCKESPE